MAPSAGSSLSLFSITCILSSRVWHYNHVLVAVSRAGVPVLRVALPKPVKSGTAFSKVVRLFQKWYGFSKSGTTFLRISHSRRRLSLSRHSLSLIRHGVRLSRARVRVPAPASRVTNSENIFHLHRHSRECRVQRLSALLHP